MNELEVMVEQYWQENQSTRRTACPSASLSATYPTWTGFGSNLSLHSEMLLINCLIHGGTPSDVFLLTVFH
jgi:hypothetical protein